MFFFSSIYIAPAQNSRGEYNELANLLFWRLSWLCLSRESLSCDTSLLLIRSLYFIQVHIFIPLIHSAPFLRFSHSLVYTNFFLCILLHEIYIFFISDDAVARNLSIIVNFSSQRPYLNYIFLSNVYSFDTMEFSMKHKC